MSRGRFLPLTKDEMKARGWSALDVLLITGDAYFDHPSHGAATIGRVLEAAGYRVGLVCRPGWQNTADFLEFGPPRLFVGVTAGAVDSLVNNWTADLRRRRDDVYAPGGRGGGRPDFATLVYANRAREAFPGVPLVLGGIEASARRFAYFDPLKKVVRRSVLIDSRADLLVYGPGEAQVLQIAKRLSDRAGDLSGIPGTALICRGALPDADGVELPSYDEIRAQPRSLLRQVAILEQKDATGTHTRFYQKYQEGVVWQEPRPAVTGAALERIYALPFLRDQHPMYPAAIPALVPIRWSTVSHRGCPGGCSFCGLALHQGRSVVSRSADSILEEIQRIAAHPEFRGTISDVGGPTANAYGLRRKDKQVCAPCKRRSCLYPKICRQLLVDHRQLCRILDAASTVNGVKRVLVASGIRHDLALRDPYFIEQLAQRHTGGQLKVAPEHVVPAVLARMRKPNIELFEAFERQFRRASAQVGKEQYLIPYFIAGFPGCLPQHADAVAGWLQRRQQHLEQVQTFVPLPGTAAAAMFATRLDEQGETLYVPDPTERRRQKRLLTKKKEKKRRGSRKKNNDFR